MKLLLILWILCNSVQGQTYGLEYQSQGPDHGNARNFNGCDWNGNPHVLSELESNKVIYSYVFDAESVFKIYRKEGADFIPLVDVSRTRMGCYAKLLYVYEDSENVNIFSWTPLGYNFVSAKKLADQPNQLVRHVLISNLNHCMLGNDPSIKSIVFEGSSQMKIIKDPSEQYPETELLFEIRPDGVYRNGIWDRTVMDNEDSSVIDEKLKTDPDYFEKLRQAREARLANDPQLKAQTKQREVGSPVQQPKPQESQLKPIATVPALPESSASIAEPVVTRNLNSWLAGLAALLAMLLGYLGWRYFRSKARP